MNDVRDALCVFVSQPNLAAFEVAGYNPDLDPDGQGAQKLIELLTAVLSKRLEVLAASTDGNAHSMNLASAIAAAASAAGSDAISQPGSPDSPSIRTAADLPDSPESEANNS